jgi:hypothetical protein
MATGPAVSDKDDQSPFLVIHEYVYEVVLIS